MLALIAGQGKLPVELTHRLAAEGQAFQLFELAGFGFDNPDGLDVTPFRIEHLGSFIDKLVAEGFREVCFAGAIGRPKIDVNAIDAATWPLLGRIQGAITAGADGALRAVVQLFEDHGFRVVGAHDIAPDLLPDVGFPTKAQPGPDHLTDIQIGWSILDQQGARDSGQASVIAGGKMLVEEDETGTDAMLATVQDAEGGILFKGPKPDQDRRVDLPTIGVRTVAGAKDAGLAGIGIEAQGVLVLDLAGVISACDEAGLFLAVVERP